MSRTQRAVIYARCSSQKQASGYEATNPTHLSRLLNCFSKPRALQLPGTNRVKPFNGVPKQLRH